VGQSAEPQNASRPGLCSRHMNVCRKGVENVPISADRARSGGEIRWLTILFADLVDSAALSTRVEFPFAPECLFRLSCDICPLRQDGRQLNL
jgi:hypothetical protein